MQSQLLDKYLEKGYNIVPIAPLKKKPALVPWGEHVNNPLKREDFNEWSNNINLALLTGRPSGLVVLDLDGEEGLRSFKVHGKFGLDTNTCTYQTTPHGIQFFFKWEGKEVRNFTRKFKGIDFRGDGGYVLVPPSVLKDGVYSWVRSPLDYQAPEIPKQLMEVSENATHASKGTSQINGWQEELLKGVTKGHRNDTATRLAGRYIERNLGDNEILTILNEWNEKNRPPLSTRDLTTILNSVRKTHQRNHPIDRASQQGRIPDLERINFLEAPTDCVDVTLPFGLHDLVEIMPSNVIVIAGEPNTGKTAFLLNVVRDNMDKFNVHYFNSEMGAGDLRKRLEKFEGIGLDDWWHGFCAYERTNNFPEVIQPGEGNINLIDFLEVHEEFYRVGGILNDIYRRLNGAIAIVALQKNYKTDIGLGGLRSLEKPRLYIAMSRSRIKIVKAKNFKTVENPNQKIMDFSLVQGWRFIPLGDWRYDYDEKD